MFARTQRCHCHVHFCWVQRAQCIYHVDVLGRTTSTRSFFGVRIFQQCSLSSTQNVIGIPKFVELLEGVFVKTLDAVAEYEKEVSPPSNNDPVRASRFPEYVTSFHQNGTTSLWIPSPVLDSSDEWSNDEEQSANPDSPRTNVNEKPSSPDLPSPKSTPSPVNTLPADVVVPRDSVPTTTASTDSHGSAPVTISNRAIPVKHLANSDMESGSLTAQPSMSLMLAQLQRLRMEVRELNRLLRRLLKDPNVV